MAMKVCVSCKFTFYDFIYRHVDLFYTYFFTAANQPLPKEGDQTNGSQPSLDDMTKPSGQVICKERSVDKDKYLNSVYMG